jgi:methyl-accepting chemotaxis protein
MMSLNKKIVISLFLATLLFVTLLTGIFLFGNKQIKDQTSESQLSLTTDSQNDVKEQLEHLTRQMSSFIVVLENDINKNMLNAAYLLQQSDAAGAIDDKKLAALRDLTGMSDLYLTDGSGNFTLTTEKAALGMNLFDIPGGYADLMTGETTIIHSPIKNKVETGDIFKFTAVPRLGGKGVIESALNISSFQNDVMTMVENAKGITSVTLLDPEQKVLLTKQADGDTDLWDAESVKSTLERQTISITGDKAFAHVYAPISLKQDGNIDYVLYLKIDVKSYFKTSANASTALNDMQKQSNAISYKMLSGFFIAMLLLIVLILIITRRALLPLSHIAKEAKLISEGDLRTASELSTNRKDEIGMLARSFKSMSDTLREMIGNTVSSASRLSSFSTQLQSSAEQTKQTTDFIAASISGIAASSSEQAKRAEQSQELTEESAQASLYIQERCDDALTSSIGAQNEAKKGSEVVFGTIKQMNIISSSTEETANLIHSLGEQSKQISQIVDVITSIASQTSLLALNAAIEAARAGEHGRGFAVVAEEVKKLAEQSGSSAKSITSLITSIQHQTQTAITSMESYRNEVTVGTDMMNQTGDAFHNIVSEVEGITKQISEVSNASKKMVSTSQKVSESVSDITYLAGQSALETQSVASSTEEQLTSIEEISDSVAHLSSMSEELETLISKFKI